MRSLLDDIANGGAHPAQDPVRALREATLAHLRELCETIRGSVLVAPDYGFEDATHIFHEYPRSEEEVRGRLELAVRQYEPRLVDVSVEIDGDTDDADVTPDLMLRFVISGSLVADGRRVPVRFTSVLRSDKRFEIR